MTKREIAIYAMIIQADIFVDGHGTTEEDDELLRKAMYKAYEVTDETDEATRNKRQNEFDQVFNGLAAEFRKKARDYVKEAAE